MTHKAVLAALAALEIETLERWYAMPSPQRTITESDLSALVRHLAEREKKRQVDTGW